MMRSACAEAPLAKDTRAMLPSCSKAMQRCPQCSTPAGSASASRSTRSARCNPNVAFQPAESVTYDRDIKTGLHHSTPYDENAEKPGCAVVSSHTARHFAIAPSGARETGRNLMTTAYSRAMVLVGRYASAQALLFTLSLVLAT